MLSYSPPIWVIVPSVGKFDFAQRLALQIESPQQRVRVLLVAGEELSANDRYVRQHGVGLRDDLAPVLVRRRVDRRLEDAIARAVFVGQQIKLAIVNLRVVQEVFAAGDAQWRCIRLQVLDVDLVLRPALFDHDGEPAAVIRDGDIGPVLRGHSFAEDQRILRGIAAKRVIEHVPVVHLLPGSNFARLGIAGVIETAIITFPGQAGGTRTLDDVGQQLVRGGFDDPQRTDFGSSRGGSVGNVLPVVRRYPPIERDGAVLGKRVHIDQNFIVAVDAFADVQHRLVLRALTAGVEVIVAADLGTTEVADLQQLIEPLVELLAARQVVENAARVRQLLGDPLLGGGTVAVFQPAIVVDDFVRVVIIGDGLLLGCGRLG